ERTARLWNAQTGARAAVMIGHQGWVLSAAFSPDGTRIVTISEDQTARLWDPKDGSASAILAGHSDWVRSAAVSADGEWVVTASQDRTARLWNVRERVRTHKRGELRDYACGQILLNDGARSFSNEEMQDPILRGGEAVRKCSAG